MEARWKQLLPELVERHQVIDTNRFTWFKVPAIVKIAIYAEGSFIRFDGGSFDGLQRVIAALNSDPWPWVKFDVTLIHRGSDPSADMQNQTLDEINLVQYDELWLFGISSGNLLSTAELNAVHSFMDQGGGVLHTGDHASLGQGIAGQIKRAGAMRQYPAPPNSPPSWNSTLRPGSNGTYEFPDQSDNVAQRIRLKYYSRWSYRPSLVLQKHPHPVLCGSEGPIRIFPDHQHEGEAIAPTSYPSNIWPSSSSGFQPKVEVIAWGKIEDPSADIGRDIGLVSVYNGHTADVGRIVADSTWHHWFDINLDGFSAATLNIIEQYFLNVAAWLAPKAKQSQMRNGLITFASWRQPLVELDPKALQPWVFGSIARDALGQYAPKCMVDQWLIDIVAPELEKEIEIFTPPGPLQEMRIPFPIEDVILANTLTPVLERNRELSAPEESIDLDVVDKAFFSAVPLTAETIAQQVELMPQFNQVIDVVRGLR